MNYKWHYDQLMITRSSREKQDGVYYEMHHKIPKSMGGDDSPENLINLTAREHFLAHWLLWRIHRNRQTACSFQYMCNMLKSKFKYTPSSRSFQEAKEARNFTGVTDEVKRKISEKLTGVKWSEERKLRCSIQRTGKGNVFFGKQLPDHLKAKISNTLTGREISIESKDKISKQFKNRKWYNDGVKSYFLHENDNQIMLLNLKIGRKCA